MRYDLSIRAIACVALAVLSLSAAGERIFAQQYTSSVIMTGLNNPRGLAWGPDGGLYVAEAGVGGNGFSFTGGDGQTNFFGTSGAISRLKDGQQETVASGLPSAAPSGGNEATGIHDLLFQPDGTLVGVFGGIPLSARGLDPGAANFGRLVTLATDGTGATASLADLLAFEQSENPDGRGIDSNPYSLSFAAGGGVVVADAAGNNLVGVADDGTVSSWTVLPQSPNPLGFGPPVLDPVPTGVTQASDGTYYVSQLTGFPFPAGAANIYRYDPQSDNLEVAFTGFTNLMDVEFGEDGFLYALQFDTFGLTSPTGPGSGVLLRVNPSNGDRTIIASAGLSFPTDLLLGPDGAIYVSNFGIQAGLGQVVRVVPEPSGIALALLAATCLAVFQRRHTTRTRKG